VIAKLEVELPGNVLANSDEASREVARFDAELGDEIAPFASVLLRSESAASSNIENLTASARHRRGRDTGRRRTPQRPSDVRNVALSR